MGGGVFRVWGVCMWGGGGWKELGVGGWASVFLPKKPLGNLPTLVHELHFESKATQKLRKPH